MTPPDRRDYSYLDKKLENIIIDITVIKSCVKNIEILLEKHDKVIEKNKNDCITLKEKSKSFVSYKGLWGTLITAGVLGSGGLFTLFSRFYNQLGNK